MTNTQYQHLGRAVELMTKLATTVEGLVKCRHDAIEELSKVVPNERANAIVKDIMSDCYPAMHLGKYIVDAMLAMKGAAK